MSREYIQDLITGKTSFSQISDVVTGIVLGEKRRGFFSVIEPTDTTVNHVQNTSFKAGDIPYKDIGVSTSREFDDGYTEVNSSLSHTDAPDCFPMYGGWCKVTPTDGDNSGMYYSLALSANSQYTFSTFVAGKREHEFLVYVTDNSGNLISKITSLSGNKNWQRLHVTFETGSAGTYRLYLIRKNTIVRTEDHFYTSFWVCEDNPFLTLPFNGAYEEKNEEEKRSYAWIGGEWCSKSVRYDSAYNSGRERFLNNYGFVLESISGLGVSGINHILEKTALDGSIWNTTKVEAREFSLVGKIQAETLEERMKLESDLYDLLTSTSKRNINQPTTLVFRVYNTENNNIIEGQSVYIYCRFSGGIASSIINENGAYNVQLSFTMDDPFIYSSMQKEDNLSYFEVGEELTGRFVTVKYNSISGVYEEVFQADPSQGGVTGFVKGNDGNVYIMGGNIIIDGEATAYDLYVYNSDTGAITGIMKTSWFVENSQVRGGIPLPDGRVIFYGGWEDNLGDVAVSNTKMVAIYDPSDGSWSSIGGQYPHIDGSVINSACIDKNGNYWFTGISDVDPLGGTGGTVVMTKWDGSTFTDIGTVDTRVFQGTSIHYIRKSQYMYVDSDLLLIGGDFDGIDSVAGTENIAIYNIADDEFLSVGNGGLNGAVHTIMKSIDGFFYVVGIFDATSDAEISSKFIIKYNLENFIAYNNVMQDFTDLISYIRGIAENEKTGEKYITYVWDRSTFDYYPLYLPCIGNLIGNNFSTESAYLYFGDDDFASFPSLAFYDNENSELWFCYQVYDYGESAYDTRIIVGEVNEIINNGETVYPKLTFVGEGNLMQIKNSQANKKINFSSYLLSDGEVITLDLEKYSKKPINLMSSVAGNITKFILPSSNINFCLVNGKNNLSAVFITDSNSYITCLIRERYLLLSKSITERNIL